ncbi:MAG: hypothetical protein PHR44_07100 [Candidatus Omnitrophica bacterium]|nr:hypothetical protein [Candidatus Omnitrophota bacterium]
MPGKGLRKIVLLLALAAVIGCIYIYPDMRFRYELGDDYRGISLTTTSDEDKYLGRVNAFYKGGNPTLSGFDNYEHVRQPWTFGFLPEAFSGVVGRVLGLSVVRVDILLSFILPAVLFLLIYRLIFELCGSQNLGILGSAGILLAYRFFTGKIWILKELLTLKYAEPLWFLRPVSPQFNHVMLILSLLLVYKALYSRGRLIPWAAAAAVGSLFYAFIYYWTFIYAGLFVLMILLALKKEYALLRRMMLIIAVSFIISIPYWLNLRQVMHHPHYDALRYFNDVVYSRKLILPAFYLIPTLLIMSFYREKRSIRFAFIVSFLAGGLICSNQHLISGMTLFPGHWLGYSNKTFLIIALFSSLNGLRLPAGIVSSRLLQELSFRVILVLMAVSALSQQTHYYHVYKARYAQRQSLSAPFSWLKEHAGQDDVVLVDPFNELKQADPTPGDILLYTNNFIFLPLFIGTIRSKEELEDRYFIALSLFGYDSRDAEEFIRHGNGAHFVCMGAIKEYGGRGIDQEYIDYLKGKSKLFLNGKYLADKLSKYRLNHILVRNEERKSRVEESVLRNNIGISEVYDDGKFSILKLDKI